MLFFLSRVLFFCFNFKYFSNCDTTSWAIFIVILHREIFQNKVLCFHFFPSLCCTGGSPPTALRFFSSIPSSPSSISSLFTPGLYSWRFVYCFCFSKVPSSPSLPLFPLSRCTIYHSLPPSHLSLCLPTFSLSVLALFLLWLTSH